MDLIIIEKNIRYFSTNFTAKEYEKTFTFNLNYKMSYTVIILRKCI